MEDVKNTNWQKFCNLNIKKKIFFIIGIFYFIFYIFNKNLKALSKDFKFKSSIAYINEIIKASHSTVDLIENDNFDEDKIKSNLIIDENILKLYKKVTKLNLLELFAFKLITMPKSGKTFRLLLNLPFFKKLKFSLYEIIDAHLELGKFFFKNKLYYLSRFYLKDLIKIFPDNANIYFLLGKSYAFDAYNLLEIDKIIINHRKNLDYGNAIYCFEKALAIQPKNQKILTELAYLYYSESKMKDAKKYYEKVVNLDPKDSNAYEKLGDISKKLNRNVEAEKYYKLAKAINNEKNYIHAQNDYLDVISRNDDKHTISGRRNKEILYNLHSAIINFPKEEQVAINAFNKGFLIILEDIDQYIYDAFAFKNIGLNKIADEYINTALNLLTNIFILIKTINIEELNILFDKYIPVNSIQKRVNLLEDYLNIKI